MSSYTPTSQSIIEGSKGRNSLQEPESKLLAFPCNITSDQGTHSQSREYSRTMEDSVD